MTESERHIQLRELITTQGESLLEQKKLVNLLMDLGYFLNNKLKYIFSTIIDEKYSQRILSYIHGSVSKDAVFPYIIDGLQTKYCYSIKNISYVLQSILYGLGALQAVEAYDDLNDYEWLNKLDSKLPDSLDEWNYEYVALNIHPIDSEVYIDYRLYVPIKGNVVTELAYGKHNYRVCAPMHHSEVGELDVVEGQQNVINVTLKPSYGSIEIISNADNALVHLDGLEVGKTPLKINKLGSGIHKIEVSSLLYKNFKEEILIIDNENLIINAQLQPNYGEVHLTCPNNNTSIYIDGIFVGNGEWTGKLVVGNHMIECRLSNHYSYSENICVSKHSKIEEIHLPELKPFYGGLKVNVLPIGCSIYLDGEHIGTTPYKTKQIKAGEYGLEVKNEETGKSIKKSVKIEQGKFTEIVDFVPDVFLSDLENVSLGDYLYEDGTYSHELMSQKKCLGFVCSLTPSPYHKNLGWCHGYILSLKEDMIENVKWDDISQSVILLPNSNKSISEWSIPSIDMWRHIFVNMLRLSGNLWDMRFRDCHYPVKMSNLRFFDEYSYWSSTSLSSLQAWSVRYNKKGSKIEKTSTYKTSLLCVRAMAAF